MNEMKPISNFKNNLYQVAIILLLAYAAFSTAIKDLDRLQEVAGNVQAATSNGLGGLSKVYSATKSLANGAEPGRAQQGGLTESPRVDVVAAGGSVALAGFDAAATSAKLSCPVHERTLPKTPDKEKSADKDLNWKVVAQVPRRVRFVRDDRTLMNPDAQVATLFRQGPRLRAIINKLPKAGRDRWSNVDELKSLSEVIGFEFKVANVEGKEQPVETIEAPAHYVFEMQRGTSDSDSDNLETQE